MKKIVVKEKLEGLEIAKDLLYKYADKKTVIFLSGGTTPKPLYETLAREKKLRLGAASLVDERVGLPDHENSNEKMIKDTGLVDYLETQNIPFYGILKHDRHSGERSDSRIPMVKRDSGSSTRMTLEKTADNYEKKVRELFSIFPKRIATMGIGEDGHIAGLPARSQKSKVKSQKYVTEVRDFPGEFKKRITLTFSALSKMDLLIVLAFGSAKRSALNLMFSKGSEEEIPARFYTKPEIAGKTILITDQKV